jgi:cytochrome P450
MVDNASTADERKGPRGCPFDLRRMDEVVPTLRSTDVEHHPQQFAAVATDPVNGEINVREFLDGAMIYLQGGEHRARRKMLNQLVRADSLSYIREDLILPEVDRLLGIRLAQPDAEGQYGLDLVDLCERVFLRFTAKLIGLVNVDTEQAIDALRSCAGPLAAGTSSAFLDDRDQINRIALEAKERYVEEFYLPARDAYREMMAEVARGEREDADVPASLMKFIVTKADPAYADEGRAIVESTMLFAASVGTSTQSVVQTVDLLQGWFLDHPEDLAARTDPAFLLDALAETIRLRAPFSPYVCRVAARDHAIGDRVIAEGQEIHVHYVFANRSSEAFGEDAGSFNPRRPSPPSGLARYGVGFGVGIHQCYGMRVVLGNEGKGGAHVHMLKTLMAAGVKPDPRTPPTDLKKDLSKFSIEDIPRYTAYPVIFTDWDPAHPPSARQTVEA